MDLSSASGRFFELFEGDSPALQYVGKWAVSIYEDRELLAMYIHLLLSALFPIYIGAHASMRRPPSAAEPEKSESEDDDDDVKDEPTIEGLSPSDAIMFPVLAGVVLTGLYFLIKWLKDPAILNKILNYYFSALGVVGVGKLVADFLHVATTFVFPTVWAGSKQTYYVDPMISSQVTGHYKPARINVHRKILDEQSNPFAGPLSKIKFSAAVDKQLWSLRALLKNHWIFRGYFHGIFSIKTNVKLNDLTGYVFGIAAVTLYNYYNKAWWLTNLMGFGFSYGTLQLMSPTTFWTGTMVLMGLFVYDIVMVFYTPMMVTVATKINAPIKLVFPGPGRGSMLGLGDVVLPGIMIALALRFDLYLHYLRKQTTTPSSSSASKTVTKAKYQDATSQWGERFWTYHSREVTPADGARFPKVYFKASLVGYVIGMSITISIMRIWNHAQPALLYLVPGVLIALWGTALVRGERGLMYGYTEDGSLDSDEKVVDGVKKIGEAKKDGEAEGEKKVQRVLGVKLDESEKDNARSKKDREENAHHVFLFSLSEPKPKKALILA